MSHEYVKCSHCKEPVMEHLAAHTPEEGSLCESCYDKSGLREKHDKELESQMRTCTECGDKFIKRNFKTEYPVEVCGLCGEKSLKEKEILSRDVPFSSAENQARNVVLGLIYRGSKCIGLRVYKRDQDRVINAMLPDDYQLWNLNLNAGEFYPKCCKLTDFPKLTLPEGDTRSPLEPGIKLDVSRSGAWVLEELRGKIFRLISVSGQIKDVSEETAISYHNAYKIANAEVVDGRLTGIFKMEQSLTDSPELLFEGPQPTKVLSAEPQVDKTADIELMKKLNAELLAACKAYYSDNNESPLSDIEYDEKFDQLLDLEHNTGVVLPDSVTQGVGVAVTGKLPKADHKDRILSLDKTKEVPALQGLLKQGVDGESGVLSWKMDGLTIVATYKEGVLQKALTRGDGKTGEDVTHNAKFFKGMPRRIPYTGEIRVRGEAVMSYSTFERINANLPEGQEPYKNPRNLASGTVRRSEITRDGSIEFIPFGVVIDDPKFKPTSYLQSLRFLTGQGFNIVEHVAVTVDTMDEAVEQFKGKVSSFDYPTDGLVLIIDDVYVYEKLGTTGRHPKGSIAFKWADEKEKTILRSIEWSASRTGVLTPVANFDPIDLEGTTVRRASVHNLSMVRKFKLGIGDEISIYKANMIIPQIAENHTQSDTVQAPSSCPVCQEATTVRQDGEAQFVICTNDECAAKNVGLLAHFAKREAMGIDGVSEKSIETLVSAGFIGKPRDFYNLKNHPEIQELPGWGKSSYSKLLYAVENSRAPKLANFIYALGIRNVGRSASDALARHFGSIEGFIGATAEEIGTVDGVGSGMTADIMAYKNKHTSDIEELAGLVSIINPGDATNRVANEAPAGITQGAPNCLAGLTFCVTGKVEFPGARTALGEYIQSLGGKLSSSVTKNTDYLITNTPDSGTSKNQSAQKLGVKIIPEVGFHSLVGELSEKVLSASEPELTQGEKVVQAGIDSVVIPEDPREARIQSAEAVQALSGVPLAGLTFCVTGKVNYGTRNELFNLIESKGGSTASSITRGVDYLITNTPDSGTVKNKRALEVGARVIDEAELMRMIYR